MSSSKPSDSTVSRGLAIFLCAAFWIELVLQVGIYQWSGKPFSSLQPYVWSPYGLVRNNPRLNSPGYTIDASGFREVREYSQVKPPNTLRVMLVGGSVLYAGLGGANPLPGVPRVTSAQTISQYLTKELQAAPACKDRKIEVINAAVNYNRISELAPAYLNEYINWGPDLVIVGSSLNNFAGGITPTSRLLGKHPWEAEFQRLVNDSGLPSTVEVVIRRISDNFATVAVARKLIQKISYYLAPKNSTAKMRTKDGLKRTEEKNTPELNARNLDRFASYANAMLGAAEIRKQKMIFFWEHDLWHSASFKPLSDDEILLQKLNPNALEENPFYWQQLEWVRKFLERHGSTLLDPQSEMSGFSGTVFIDYGHYTAGGNAFMAGVIAKRLLAQGICHS